MPTSAERLRDEGRREGMKEGMKEGKLETVRRMLSDDVPIETIIKYTGLTEKEIKALMH
jgi:predicted transposase/invertase (TIGR01784 family)